ncbi:neuropeptide F [Nomia melanderi]|uniref:neuropeptide F n=1 Tax=Nomia melanderi TaxID=2448451 RepID=UPI0013047A16|nr:uncharacterized protein LOC116428452 [Nomia melanderi]
MRTMQSYPSAIYLLAVLAVLETVMVHGDPDPMARPTRPEVFLNSEELRRYLDHVTDWYSLNGKARYGKRDEIPSAALDDGRAWDTVKTMLDVSQESQQPQPRFEERRQPSRQYIRELASSGDGKHASRTGTRPYHMLDIVEKYYNGAQ